MKVINMHTLASVTAGVVLTNGQFVKYNPDIMSSAIDYSMANSIHKDKKGRPFARFIFADTSILQILMQ